MNISGDKLLRLLQPEQPTPVRHATVVVLREIAPARDGNVSEALCTSLGDADGGVRLEAINAVGKLRIAAALPQLLERIKDGGPEADAAAHAAAKLGAKGTKGLHELMPRVAPGLRRYIAAALAADGSATDDSNLDVLCDSDPQVVEAAARSLLQEIPKLDTKRKQALTESLLHLAGNKKSPLSAVSDGAVVRLLAALDNKDASGLLWDRITPTHPAEVRAAALNGLGKWADAPSKDHLRSLFACASSTDFRLAGPAMVLLRKLPVADKAVPEWVALLTAPDVGVRRVALEKVGDRDTAAVGEALMAQLNHPDRGLADAALARLTRLDHGRELLTEALIAADTTDHAWPLARAQAPFARDYPAKIRDEIFAKACRHLEAGDRRADPLLFLLRDSDPADLKERVVKQAATVRKKKKYDTAIVYLRTLTRDPACGLPIRVEQAACGLKVSPRDLAADARSADPSLEQFMHLGHQLGDDLAHQIEAIKWLEPEELYYLGFHLAEQDATLRKIGTSILQLVVKRAGKTKIGQSAKSKLYSAGL
jgi:hypothetical protein